MNYAHTNTHARQSSGFARLALAAFTLLALIVAPASSAWAGDDFITIGPGSMDSLVRLLNSPNHPVPALPIIVPQLVNAEDVDHLVAPGNLPTVFQITQPTGQNADL